MNSDHFLNLIISNKKDLEKNLPILKVGKKEIQKGVFLGKNVIMEPNIFFDTTNGEIVIGDNTKIRANVVLRGPLSIGHSCIISSFAEISCSQIGDVCKIGGEVGDSIISNYSNKQHYGCLFNSYVGSWVNIGAGTNISNLKNSYGSVKMNGKDTGQQMLGSIIGDYCKIASNTSFFCGKVIGESSHLYGIVINDVPAFVSYASSGNLFEIPLEIALKIQKAMMKRRGLELTEKETDKIEKLFKATVSDRKKAKVKKGKLLFK